jgi:hypothetical protein
MDKVKDSKFFSLYTLSYDVISMLDLLEDYLELRSIPYARLDGGTSRPRRNLDIKLVGVMFLPR